MQRSSKARKFSRRKPWWKKHIKKLLLILALLGYLYYLLFGSYGFINITRLKRKEVLLRKEKRVLLEERMALTDSLSMIKQDTFLLEKFAREKLGMMKPGDTIILEIER